MRQYTGATDSVLGVARVGDGHRQIAGLTRHELVIWDEGSEEPTQRLAVSNVGFTHVRLLASADGNWLASGGETRHLLIWRYRDSVWQDHRHEVHDGLCAARFSDQGTLTALAVADGESNSVEFYLTRTTLDSRRAKAAKVVTHFSAFPAALRFGEELYRGHWWATDLSPDSRWVLLSAREKKLHVWNVESGDHVGTVKLRGLPNEAAFSPDGQRFAVDGGTTVYIHDTRTLELVASWRVPHCYVPQLAWSPDGRWLARSDLTAAVRKYNVAEKREGEALGVPRQRARSVAFSQDGSTYLVGTARGAVVVWDFDE